MKKFASLAVTLSMVLALTAAGVGADTGKAAEAASEEAVSEAVEEAEAAESSSKPTSFAKTPTFELTDEIFDTICIENTDQSEAIAEMPAYGKDDTWAFYVYMVGSDLESRELDELSDISKLLIQEENKQYETEKTEKIAAYLQTFSNDLNAAGADLPKRLYNPVSTPVEFPAEYEEAEYYAPDPDVQGYASANLEAIFNADYNDNVKVVVQTGGAKRWQNAYINPNRSQRLLVDKDGFRIVYDEPLVNMATPESLSDFLTYCTENYDADHKVVIFWNHGGGVNGYGWDEIYADKFLSVPELSQAFQDAFGNPGEEPVFEAIGFDACLMASAEVADYLSGYAKYLYASEEIEPGNGWDYQSFLNALYENPEMNGAQLGKAIADTYLRFNAESIYVMSESCPGMTFSVVDLSKAPAVYSAYSELAKAELKNVIEDPAELAAISRAASKSLAYAGGAYKQYNLFDLTMFMDELPEKYSTEAGNVKTALDEAVLYARNTYILEGSGGLSVYYPLYSSSVSGLYSSLRFLNDVSKNKDINALYYYKLAGCLNDTYKQYLSGNGYAVPETIDFSVMNMLTYTDVECDGTGNFTLKLDPEMMAVTQNVRFSLAQYDEETGDIEYLGNDAYAYLKEDGTVETIFGGNWITYGDVYLPLEIVSETSENIIYKTPILYAENDAFLLSSYNVQENDVFLLGICLEDDLAVPGRNYYQITPGEEFYVVKEAGNINSMAKTSIMELVTVDEDTVLEERPLADGSYLEFLEAYDLRDDVYYSKIMTMTMEDGEVAEQEVNNELMSFSRD
ncbi:MAG: hypothetical protein HUJ73_08940 [Eubacterium sp.]|nr:hypothetical protein [Eubacterium sp.]